VADHAHIDPDRLPLLDSLTLIGSAAPVIFMTAALHEYRQAADETRDQSMLPEDL